MQVAIKRTGFFLLLILIWQGIVLLNIWPESMIPSPISVGKSLYDGFMDLTLVYDIVASFRHLFIGLFFSIIIGTALGFLLANRNWQMKQSDRWCLHYKVYRASSGYRLLS